MKRQDGTAPAPRLRVGERLGLRIESMATGGRGVARHGRWVVFVEGGVAGDLVEAEIRADRNRFFEAVVVSVTEPSPDRVEPRCRHAGICGGCAWQHIAYPAQLAAKKAMLEDALRRLGKLPAWPEIEIVAGEPWGYRSRAQFQPGSWSPGEGGRPLSIRPRSNVAGFPSAGPHWGFFRAGSRDIVRLEECPVLVGELQGIWRELPPPEVTALAEPRRERVAHVFGAGGRRYVLHPRGGDAWAVAEIGGRPFHFRTDGFFQSNVSLLPRLVERAVGGLSGRWAVDLYAGVGLFAAFLEEHFERVDAVESAPESAEAAARNLRRANYHAASVEDWLDAPEHRGARPDVVVLDPPRAGLTGRALAGVLALEPRSIRYVSCGHDTLARDLGGFVRGGYVLEALSLVDFYPHTPHMECLAVLQRG